MPTPYREVVILVEEACSRSYLTGVPLLGELVCTFPPAEVAVFHLFLSCLSLSSSSSSLSARASYATYYSPSRIYEGEIDQPFLCTGLLHLSLAAAVLFQLPPFVLSYLVHVFPGFPMGTRDRTRARAFPAVRASTFFTPPASLVFVVLTLIDIFLNSPFSSGLPALVPLIPFVFRRRRRTCTGSWFEIGE